MKVVVLTGAGISAESGIQTFRDQNGLWENHPIEQVASPQGFMANPKLVHEFYNKRREQLLSDEVGSNKAHDALALLEHKLGSDFLLVTQNIDDLHERAGSTRLIHMHGELLKIRCKSTGKIFKNHESISVDTPCPCCNLQQSFSFPFG